MSGGVGGAGASPVPTRLFGVFRNQLFECRGSLLDVGVDDVAQHDLRWRRGGGDHDGDDHDGDREQHEDRGPPAGELAEADATIGAWCRGGPWRGRRGVTAPAAAPPLRSAPREVAVAKRLVAAVSGPARPPHPPPRVPSAGSPGEMPRAPSLIARPISRAVW